MQLVYLFKGLELSPDAVRRIVAAVPSSAYDDRRMPDRFTFRESVAHLADWETVNFERLQVALNNPGGPALDLDESQRAIDNGYASIEPKDAAETFAASRAKLLVVLSTLSDEDWQKTFIHSTRGVVTVLELAILILGHDMYHIEQFTQALP